MSYPVHRDVVRIIFVIADAFSFLMLEPYVRVSFFRSR